MTFTAEAFNDGKPEFVGRKKVVTGKFANTTDAKDGLINTGLRRVETFEIQMIAEGNTAPTIAYPKITTFPADQEGITIRAAADTAGTWKATGE